VPFQGGQEAAPEHFVLALAHVQAQHFPAAVGGDPGHLAMGRRSGPEAGHASALEVPVATGTSGYTLRTQATQPAQTRFNTLGSQCDRQAWRARRA
jgi:hypothetical protein